MNTSQSTTSGISIVEILISLALGSILALSSIDIHLPLGAQDRHRAYQFITN